MDPEPTDVDVVIAGGGPAGLAAATSLASSGLSVTVVERRGTASEFEVQRAYLYLLDRRGQQWTDRHNLTGIVRERGVLNKGYTITRAFPNEKGAVTVEPMLAGEASASAIWVPRATLLEVFANAAVDSGAKLQYGKSVKSISKGEPGGRVRVELDDGALLRPRLLLGCDGIESRVRNTLKDWSGDVERFDPVVLPSASSGLQYKMLLVPPSFELCNLSLAIGYEDGQPLASAPIVTQPQSAYTVPSLQTARRERLRLGLLPSRDPSLPRTANIIKPSDHRIWTMRTGDELLAFLGASFPQIDDISQLVSSDEADAFVKASPGVFPAPQYVRTLATEVGGTGVALLGDAAHAFPPDVGQGVNSALEDVCVLTDALEAAGALPVTAGSTVSSTVSSAYKPVPWSEEAAGAAALSDGLGRYQAERAPAAEALARIVRVGFPFQYDQSFWRAKLFVLGFGLRLLLSRTLGKLPMLNGRIFSPPVAFGVLAGEPYSQVWQKAQRTTAAIWTLAAALLTVAARRLLLA